MKRPEAHQQRLETLFGFSADRADPGPVARVGGVYGGEDDQSDEALQGDTE